MYIKIYVNDEQRNLINELKEMTGDKNTSKIFKRALMNEYINSIQSLKNK